MANKKVSRVEIAEVIRRWKAGRSQRHIASGAGLSRDTVCKYLAAAQKVGVRQDGPAPTEEHLSHQASVGRSGPRRVRAPSDDLLAPWADQFYRWLTIDHLQLTRIQDCWLRVGAGYPAHRCSGSSSVATGVVTTPGRFGWRRVRLERWPTWTSGVWGSSVDPQSGCRHTV